jgi:hypothetical protein
MRWFLAAALCGGFFVAAWAQGETLCGERDSFAVSLRENYGELPMGIGLTPDGRLIEMFVSERGSFTVLVTAPNGFSCVIAVGSDWEREDFGRRSWQTAPRMTH